MKVYPDYSTALAACDGYEDAELVAVVSEKTDRLRNSLGGLPTLEDANMARLGLALALNPSRELHVLELGGACGAAYYSMRGLFPGRIKSWHVVETEAMAAEGNARFADDTLRFFNNLESACADLTRRDLAVSLGCLQYTPEPLGSLDALLDLHFSSVYLARIEAGWEYGCTVVTRQDHNLSLHGPGPMPESFADRTCSQPITLVPFEEYQKAGAGRYATRFIHHEGAPGDFPTENGAVPVRSFGILFEQLPK